MQLMPLQPTHSAASPATTTAFDPVSARFAPAAGVGQPAGSAGSALTPAGQLTNSADGLPSAVTRALAVPAPGSCMAKPSQQHQPVPSGSEPKVHGGYVYLSMYCLRCIGWSLYTPHTVCACMWVMHVC